MRMIKQFLAPHFENQWESVWTNFQHYIEEQALGCLPAEDTDAERQATVSQIGKRKGKAQRLRELLSHSDQCILVPGCHDALGCKLIEQAGFDCAYFSGFALSASRLALPDIGLATYNEMLESARACCDAVSIPVIGDGDTGYGGILNVRRTVHGYARANLAAISIEDQIFPKRCSYAKGAAVVQFDEALERVRAAVRARDEILAQEDRDILIIARTDAIRCAAFSRDAALREAKRRCKAFEAAGADIVYAEGLETEEEMRMLACELTIPSMVAQVERPGRRMLSPQEAGNLGFRMLLRGVTLLNVYVASTRRALAALRHGQAADATSATPAPPAKAGAGASSEEGRVSGGRVDSDGGGNLALESMLLPFEELYRAVGFDECYAWEASLAAEQPPR